MIHLGKNTKSKIISKGISAGNADNTYRGLVDIGRNSKILEIIPNVTLVNGK